MKCRLDPSDEEYRVYRLSSLAITMQGHQPKGINTLFDRKDERQFKGSLFRLFSVIFVTGALSSFLIYIFFML